MGNFDNELLLVLALDGHVSLNVQKIAYRVGYRFRESYEAVCLRSREMGYVVINQSGANVESELI